MGFGCTDERKKEPVLRRFQGDFWGRRAEEGGVREDYSMPKFDILEEFDQEAAGLPPT